jgi:hypothetical protein
MAICNKERSDTHKLFIQLDMLALECVEEMRRVKRGARWQVYRQDPSSVFSCLCWSVRVRDNSSVLQAGLDMCFRLESGGLLWPALSLCGQPKQACETEGLRYPPACERDLKLGDICRALSHNLLPL